MRWFWDNPDFGTKKKERFSFVIQATPGAKQNLSFTFVPIVLGLFNEPPGIFNETPINAQQEKE
jgi:hypothetical protein